jgi:hypothetical protein
MSSQGRCTDEVIVVAIRMSYHSLVIDSVESGRYDWHDGAVKHYSAGLAKEIRFFLLEAWQRRSYYWKEDKPSTF